MIPTTMRAAVLRGPRVLEIEERPVPEPGQFEVLIQVLSAAISGSDLRLWTQGRVQHRNLEGPLVLGRTGSGRVVAVGPGVAESRVGELVSIEPLIICRHCKNCRLGRYNLCSTVAVLGAPGVDGIFREYLVMPDDFAHPVPEELGADVAALIEPMSVGLAALRKAEVGAGSRLLITGAGVIGRVTVAVAKALGAAEIEITDLSPRRLEEARALGATATHNMGDAVVLPPGSFDALIECSGSPAAVRRGLPTVRPAGRVVLVGRSADELAIPVGLLQNNELTLMGSFRYANTFGTAIDLAAAGLVDLSALVGQHFPLEDLESALRRARSSAPGKSMVHPSELVRGSAVG